MSQLGQHHLSNPVDPDGETLVHDLRDRLNTIKASAMVLERKGSVDLEDRKYLDWILEKATEAGELIGSIRKHDPD